MKPSSKLTRRKRPGDKNEDCKPPAKKRACIKRGLAADIPVSLPLDALSLVMEFLSPRQLFTLAFTCKNLRASITAKLVIKAALIHGGHPQQTMVELYQLMSKKAMYVPSPLRLLRLANGKRCEFCGRDKVKHVRPGLGIFACGPCTINKEGGLTNPWEKIWEIRWEGYMYHNKEYDEILKNPRLSTYMSSQRNVKGGRRRKCDYYHPNIVCMWKSPQTLLNGERIGPLATCDDIDRIFAHTQRGGSVESYLQDKLFAPPEDAYQEFNDTFEQTLERSKQVAKEREEKKATNKVKAKENKLAKIQKMTEDLAGMLYEPFRAFALKTKENSGPIVEFEVPFIDHLLRPYALAPSKMRKKILLDIAKTINEKLSLISKTRFVTLEFLSEDDPFEAALKNHFGNDTVTWESLFGHWRYRYTEHLMTDDFFNLLEKGQLIGALVYLKGFEGEDLRGFEGEDLSCLLATTTEEEKVLARTVWLDLLRKQKEADEERDDHFRKPFRRWNLKKEKKADDADEEYCDDHFRRAFATAQATFPKLLRGLQDYIAWLGKKCPKDPRRRASATGFACEDEASLPFLLAANFQGLFKRQEGKMVRGTWGRYC